MLSTYVCTLSQGSFGTKTPFLAGVVGGLFFICGCSSALCSPLASKASVNWAFPPLKPPTVWLQATLKPSGAALPCFWVFARSSLSSHFSWLARWHALLAPRGKWMMFLGVLTTCWAQLPAPAPLGAHSVKERLRSACSGQPGLPNGTRTCANPITVLRRPRSSKNTVS